ncbi:MAG: YtxH domain-containing protein [Anaerolineales bacterium]|nr:YtxH domain-containing protein [Anaerolineales bacterium]
MNDNAEDFGAFLVGLVLGGLVGAVAALLMAPQSGEETRVMIRDKSVELRDAAAATADDAITRAEAALDDARARASELREKSVNILGEQRSQLETAMTEDSDSEAAAN